MMPAGQTASGAPVFVVSTCSLKLSYFVHAAAAASTTTPNVPTVAATAAATRAPDAEISRRAVLLPSCAPVA